MDITTPKNWRKGQTLFNFLWWLKTEHNFSSEVGDERMADPFHISDKEFDAYYEEFLKHHGPNTTN